MNSFLTRSKRRQTILLLGVFSFVFHVLTPYFHPAMASTTDGYKQTICTIYGSKTVFVALENNQQQKPPACFECPACIVQANASGWIEADNPFVESQLMLRQPARKGQSYLAPAEPLFPDFLSRAPPL